MSRLSGRLRSGVGGRVGCDGRAVVEEQGCDGSQAPYGGGGAVGVQEGVIVEPSAEAGAQETLEPLPSPSLTNGLHVHRKPVLGTRRRRQTETHTHTNTPTQTPEQTVIGMQTHKDVQMHTPPETCMDAHTHTGAHTHMDAHTHLDSASPEHPRTDSLLENHTRSPQRQALLPVNHSACTNQQAAFSPYSPVPPHSANRDMPPAISPAPIISSTPLDLSKPSRAIGPNPPGHSPIGPAYPDLSTIGPACVDPSPVPVEGERKYALRSSGRPRFPCQLRKSSRIRRSTEDGERRGGRESEREEVKREEEEEEEKERVSVHVKVERSTVEECLPAASKPADSPVPVPVAPLPSPHPSPRPSSHPAPRPLPKPQHRTLTKPQPKSSTNAKPKSQPRPSMKASPKPLPRSATNPRPATHPLPRSLTNTVPRPAVKKEEPGDLDPPTKRKRRFVGVRRIVVKVARIPVNLSRRQKSYKISSMETVEKGWAGGEGGLEGAEGGTAVVREPTALLRMKNNGKSVMVMFPPGELPVILKRRRGRPPKQVVPGTADKTTGGNGEPKKPRRRRRAKLPSPQPSYVNDTNDVKTEYGDVLSKLAFLNRQPPTTGRCSPPRCWTPSEPDSFHTPSDNPGISALLHRLTGFRRRGGRGGGVGGRGGGVGGGAGGAGGAGGEGFKSSFSNFFETIGKKRKVTPSLSEPGLLKKRGKGGGGRGGGAAGAEMGVGGEGEKPVRKRRSRKNGVLKGETEGQLEQDWSNGGGVWGEEGGGMRERGPGGYQVCGSPRGGFPSCEGGRGSAYDSPGGSRGGGEEAQGLFAGYFRSLLDSDNSSDLLDISSPRPDPRKPPPTPGYDSSSPAHGPGPRWSPAFPKRSLKGEPRENPTQHHPSSSSSSRPPYSYNLSQNSPTTSSFPKSTPPSLPLTRSPSSPHISSSSYSHYPSGYSSSPAGGSAAPQRPADCSFAAYGGAGLSKASTATPMGQGQMGYSSFPKRGYGGYPGQVGPSSPGRGGYMAMAKNSPFPSSSSPDGYRPYPSNQWNYRQGYGGWAVDSLGHHYPGYSDYVTPGPSEPKDILDISNYTPQKAKRQPFLESLSESSSDSSHLGLTGSGGGVSGGGSGSGSGGGAYRQGGGRESLPIGGEGGQGQSSLSSLEKLMMDWHESASGPSYNWSQNVLFQGQGKPSRGRRKRNAADPQTEKEGGGGPGAGPGPTPDSPTSPPAQTQPSTATQGSGGKRSGIGGRQARGVRGGRGGLSPSPGGKKGKAAGGGVGGGGGAAQGGLFQECLDYYSGDSSSLSPLPTPTPHLGYPTEPCEYPSPSPYSAHPSTPSSEEHYPALFPGEASSSSLSPGMTSTSYPPKLSPAPQPYHPPLTPAPPPASFSPSCSPSPRLLPALSPPHRNLATVSKDHFPSQYDSPSYCSSPYWYGGASLSGSPSPHANTHTTTHTHANAHGNTHVHANVNPHTSPNNHPNPHTTSHPHTNTHTHHNSNPHANMSPHTPQTSISPHTHPNPNPHTHTNPHINTHLHLNQNQHPHPHPHPNTYPHPHLNTTQHSHPNLSPHTHPQSHPNLSPHTHPQPNPNLSPHSHTHPLLYEECPPHSAMPPHGPTQPHKRDLPPHLNSGLRPAPLQVSPYPSPHHKPPLASSPHSEDMGYPPYPGMHPCYHPQPPTRGGGGGVLCQLLDPPSDDSFSVTSL